MLYTIHQEAERFYLSRRPGSWVPDYLTARGFDEAVQHDWRIGYAPNRWTDLTDHLRGLGFPDSAIKSSGLAYEPKRGGLIDTFRDRAMLPITRPDATTIAFIGRSASGEPKYLNSPETPIYHKGSTLFGLDRVRHGVRPVLVEGPLDAIAITITAPTEFAGTALCGTALTPHQVDALAQVSDQKVVIALDGDPAGLAAAIRAYKVLDADAVRFPDGRDPADLLRRGELGTALRHRTQPLADLVIDATIDRWSGSLHFAEGTIGAMREAATVIVRLRPDDVARQVDRVATRLGLGCDAVTEAVTDLVAPPLAKVDFPNVPTPGGTSVPTKGRRHDERIRAPRRPTR
ncbi:toprim domain-containing protein [Streptosporangium soli]|nr:toprim domain-containing protein [Streptosporangium sp. KLBMP 9127]